MGWILGAVIMCIWFVSAPAAVAEQLGPVGALKRSGELTHGRRWRIFGLTILLGIVLAVFLLAWLQPKFQPPHFEVLESPRKFAIIFVIVSSVSQLLFGIVEAVSYALLREDKDGLTHEQLARVFD
jgi:MFS family permease